MTIPENEWHFARLFKNTYTKAEQDQLKAAVVWEYARSQPWICAAASLPLNDGRLDLDRSELQELDARLVALSIFSADSGEERKGGSRKGTGDTRVLAARFSPVEKNTPVYHDVKITLSSGFPSTPYLSTRNAVASVEHLDAVPSEGVVDLNGNFYKAPGRSCHPGAVVLGSNSVSEPHTYEFMENGRPLDEGAIKEDGSPRNPQSTEWLVRKFTLGIDYSRTDEELKESFGRFLRLSRTNCGLSCVRRDVGPARGGEPAWMNAKNLESALNALCTFRLLRFFGGEASKALEYYHDHRQGGNPEVYCSEKEFTRAAKRAERTAMRLFRMG